MGRRFAAVAAAFLAAGTVVLAGPTAAHADETRDKQWYLDSLGVNEAHKYSQGAGITIGVIDSGIDATHPDLKGNVKAGKDFGDSKDNGLHDAAPHGGHGTGVASILAGHGHGNNHADGIMGIAPKAKIISAGEACDEDPCYGGPDVIGQAIKWLVDQKVDIISISLSGGGGDSVDYATKKGIPVVVSAGNTRDDHGKKISNMEQPATTSGVIPVAGTTKNNNAWNGSLTLAGADPQPRLGLSAPAEDLPSAKVGGGYVTRSGTTGSAPIVAGTLALIKAAYPKLNYKQVNERLLETVDDKGPKGFDDKYGWGIVNPLHALSATVHHHDGAPSTKSDMLPLSQQGKHGGTTGSGKDHSAGDTKALSAKPSGLPIWGIALIIVGLVVIAAIAFTAAARRRRRSASTVRQH